MFPSLFVTRVMYLSSPLVSAGSAAFFGVARVPESRLIVAAMLDLQNSTLLNLPLFSKSQMAAGAYALQKKIAGLHVTS